MTKEQVLVLFEQGLQQGIALALSQLLPLVPYETRRTVSKYIADLVVRLLESGGYDALKNAPLKEAPLMDLSKELK
mgnify:CR=1 FL=1